MPKQITVTFKTCFGFSLYLTRSWIFSGHKNRQSPVQARRSRSMRRVSDDYSSVSPHERSSRERRKSYYYPPNSDNASSSEDRRNRRRYEREDRSRRRSSRDSRRKSQRAQSSRKRSSDRNHNVEGQLKAENGSPGDGKKKALRVVMYKSDDDDDDAQVSRKEQRTNTR